MVVSRHRKIFRHAKEGEKVERQVRAECQPSQHKIRSVYCCLVKVATLVGVAGLAFHFTQLTKASYGRRNLILYSRVQNSEEV